MRNATVLFRFPGDLIPYVLSGLELSEKPEGSGFCFVPYDSSFSAVFISGVPTRLSDPVDEALLSPAEYFDASQKVCGNDEHIVIVNKAIAEINSGAMEKVVLAKNYKFDLQSEVHVAAVFDALSHAYPNAFVYCFRSKTSGTWIGATPELLLKTHGKRGETAALAGTRLKGTKWGEKEIHEQQLVTEYISEVLKKHEVDYIDTIGPMDLNYGQLRHLKSEINFESVSPAHVLTDLFPTPATCGKPVDAARKFILENECTSRSYYSGYLGSFDSDNNVHFYVNLRCMKLFKDAALVYAGSGITAQSDAPAETLEVENKANAISMVFKDIVSIQF